MLKITKENFNIKLNKWARTKIKNNIIQENLSIF